MLSLFPDTLRPRSSPAGPLTLDTQAPPPHDESAASDHYEILRVSPRADRDSIERVYRTLSERFHPDNPGTGDAKAFQRIRKAWDILSTDAERAKYNAARQNNASKRFWLRGNDFYDGVKGGQNRRLAVLCLLYRQRIASHESPGLAIVDLEQWTGCTSEELTSALWYLCEKNWAALGDLSDYSITAEGFDVVEREAEELQEFRALASLSWYDLAGDQKRNALPADIAAGILGNASVADHYEVLRIDPQAERDTIERVYQAFATRYHPDNPLTGDAKTFLRITQAWEVLSDPARRAEYNAFRQSPEFADRFRLRRREFFDGIEGEQLRRLAVLCHLYRQAANKLPGLFGRDLEQLTGCTREELGPALWYLREKKWARLGGFSEYTITATGFDIVENEVVEPAGESRQTVPVTAAPETPSEMATVDAPVIAAQPAPGESEVEGEPPSAEASHAGISHRLMQIVMEKAEDSAPPAPPVVAPPVAAQPIITQPIVAPPVVHLQPEPVAAPASRPAVSTGKRVILSMGGKGGVGKTSVMTGLAEWFDSNQVEVSLLDLDIENKMKGSLTHYFGSRVPKINIHTPAGLDAFVDHLGEGAPVILADMGAGAGHVTHDWFEKMYPDVSAIGISFTAIGVVTSDPASVESVLNWAAALQDSVSYVIVENHLTEHASFTYWHDNIHAQEFRQRYSPAVIRQDYRLPDLENAIRKYGVTLGQVAGRTTSAPELQKASLVMRAQSYRRRIFAEFDKVKGLLLP
ncbi:MAG TPA: DnaJ domain-containing protein [Bryobacteraceae bacterium]|nr:DnaJ domain-containing protein [Bryobacteraceae bacterium]